MKEVKGITSLSYGAIACNAVLISVMCINSDPSHNDYDAIGLLVAGVGVVISILYAVQLILMNRDYYRQQRISTTTKVLFHIYRIIELLYSIAEACLLAAGIYYSFVKGEIKTSHEFKAILLLAALLVTVVMNLTIFFRGWRLLKLVRKNNYIEEVMASFD